MAEPQNEIINFANGMTIVLQQSPIAGGDTDVIVNTTLTNLNLVKKCLLEEYIDTEILRKIQLECNAKAPMGLELGEYVVTNVGRGFENSFVYHVACWTEAGESLDYQEYVSLLAETFQAASDMNKFSIVVPAMEITSFRNEQEATEHDLAKLIINMSRSLAECSDYKLRTIFLNFYKKNKVLYEIYKQVLIQKPENQSNSIYLDHVKARSRDLPSISASMGPTGATDLTPWTAESMSQSIDPTGKGASSTPQFDRLHDPDVRPKEKCTVSNIKPSDSRNATDKMDDTKLEQVTSRNGIIIKVYKGGITTAPVEAIVHGSNKIDNRIDISDAVGKALSEAGGSEFERACHLGGSITDQRKLVITRAGNMHYSRIYHINTSLCRTAEDWQKIICTTLVDANLKQLKSIGFLPLETAYGDASEQAKNCTVAIDVFAKEDTIHIREIHFVLFDDTMCSVFRKVILSDTETKDQSLGKVNPLRRPDSEFTVNYKGVNVTVKEEVFTAENVDCIVHGYFVAATLHNPVNILLQDTIGRILQERGGTAFKRICDATFIKKFGLTFSNGGPMCKEVLHIDVSAVKSTGHYTLENFTYKCLTESNGRRLKSIVFPVMIRDYMDAQAGQHIFGVKAFIDSTSRIQLKDIRFVVDNVALLKSYKDLMQNTFGITSEAGYNASESKQHPQIHTPALSTNKSSLTIEVVEGDITKDASDMIVHGTKGSYGAGIQLNGKLGQALEKAGGVNFVRVCRENNVPPKGLIVTTAGDMKCHFVLHVDISTIQYSQREVWKKVTNNILNEAEKRNLNSIAFPAMGMVGLPGALPDARELVSHFKAAINEFEVSRPVYLKLIRFVVHDKSLLKTYRELLLGGTNTGGAVPSGAVLNPIPTNHDITLTGGNTGDLDMSIVCGDLTKETTECIVHATQNPIAFGGQSGGALRKAGGPDFEREATTARYDINTNTVLTSAGKLACKHVLHLKMPKSSTVLKDKLEALTDRILECLNTANDAKINSLSFPALGTGVLRCKPAEISKCFRTAIHKFNTTRKTGHLNLIRLVVYEQSMMEEFTNTLSFE